ncbi:translation initiation factor Sui1, partial [candidate division MSBL1 archaeon SCGC-AAA259O05]
MPKTCPTCGLPQDVCTCEDISHEREKARVFTELRPHGKMVTIIDGLDDGSRDLEGLASELKKSFGCGGTVKNG